MPPSNVLPAREKFLSIMPSYSWQLSILTPPKLEETRTKKTYSTKKKWSQYCDFFNDPNATDAYRVWSSYFKETDGFALDIGCSVGRLSFELSKAHSHLIGIDTSISFIRKARELLSKKELDFNLIISFFLGRIGFGC